MSSDRKFPWQQEAVIHHSQRLLYSFQHWTGNCLLNVSGSLDEIAQALFEAPFVLVSHGIELDPIFNYGNRKALELWELSWQEFTQMPSRKTAQEVMQEERNRLLAETTTQGFSNYIGFRITSTGQPFEIQDGIIWNILDEKNQRCGQASAFSNYKFMNK